MAYGWGIREMGDGCTLIDSHHNSLDGPPIVATCFQQFLLLLFRTSYALSAAAAVALLISVFFFFLHKTLLICFTCHTKLELSWVFKKRSAPASPASSTSCPRVCVCVETTQTVDIYHQGCPSRGWKLSNLSPDPGLAREACAVISFAFIFRGCKLEKCCMKINKS